MRHISRTDLMFAAVLAVTGMIEVALSATPFQRPAMAVALMSVAAALLLLRSVQPLACLAGMAALVVVSEIPGTGPGVTAALVGGLLLALGSVGKRCPERISIPAMAGSVAVFAIGAAFTFRPWDVVVAFPICGAAWGAGRLLRREADRNTALQSLTADLAAERELRAREAVQAEKMRIARELHDTIAHTVSVITLQVGGVRRRLDSDPNRGPERDVLLDVEGLGREAVAELHRMLGVLRSPYLDTAPITVGMPPGPPPRLADVPQLVARVRATGVPVDLQVDGPARALPPGLELAAYRVVQEALTNVLKHATGASARVSIAYAAADVTLLIENTGTAITSHDPDGSGLGLDGVRERVALYGGRVDSGPQPPYGFAVRATLPAPQRPRPCPSA